MFQQKICFLRPEKSRIFFIISKKMLNQFWWNELIKSKLETVWYYKLVDFMQISERTCVQIWNYQNSQIAIIFSGRRKYSINMIKYKVKSNWKNMLWVDANDVIISEKKCDVFLNNQVQKTTLKERKFFFFLVEYPFYQECLFHRYSFYIQYDVIKFMTL